MLNNSSVCCAFAKLPCFYLQINHCTHSHLVFALPSVDICEPWFGRLQDVTALFSLGKVLGRGQFGTTREATERATGEKYACKSISKRKLM